MKKIFFILLYFVCIYGGIAQTTAKGPFSESLESNLNLIKAGTYSINPTNYVKPKIKFKHSAGPAHCDHCMCPLGICIIIPFFSETLTSAQIDDGYGTASIEIVNSKLVLTFDQPAALSDGTIPIEANFFIGSEYSTVLGFTSVTIIAGTYTVTDITDATPYGKCTFECIFQ